MMTDVNNFQYVREHVREVPDFPKKGILFLDVTTIVKDAKAFNMCIDFLYEILIMLPELNQEGLFLVHLLPVNSMQALLL